MEEKEVISEAINSNILTDTHSKNFNYVVSRKIYYAFRSNGFFSAIVEGRRGIGKSSYSLKTMHDIFVYLGYDDDVAWQMAIDRMLYNINDIVDFIDQSNGDKKEVVFTWDDAGVFGGNLRYFSHMKEVNLLSSLMDTIRSSVGGILLTCPSQFGLLKFLRRYDNYLINIIRDPVQGSWYRIARGYLKNSLPSGKVIIYKKFDDFFSAYLPNKWYEVYMKKRHEYNKTNAEYLKELIEKQDAKKRMGDVKEAVQKLELKKRIERMQGGDV